VLYFVFRFKHISIGSILKKFPISLSCFEVPSHRLDIETGGWQTSRTVSANQRRCIM